MGGQSLVGGHAANLFRALIEEVEKGIIKQLGDSWDRDLFENHLMGYTMRTDRYRLVSWQDYRNPAAKPLFVELYDHQTDPRETVNLASKRPRKVDALLKQFKLGWRGNRPKP